MSGRIFILNFHGLGWPNPALALEDGEENYWIDPAFFESILDLVRDRKDVQITFDDANESDYLTALPALKKRGLTARFFMVAGRIGRKGYVSLPQLQSLLAAGMGIGTHGMRHRPWRGLSDPALREELVEAREQLQGMTNLPIAEAACPWGSYDRRVLQVLRVAGYQRVYTSDEGHTWTDSWLQARTSIMRSHDLLAVKRITSQSENGPRQFWRALKLALKRRR